MMHAGWQVVLARGLRERLQAALVDAALARSRDAAPAWLLGAGRLLHILDVMDDATAPTATHTQVRGCLQFLDRWLCTRLFGAVCVGCKGWAWHCLYGCASGSAWAGVVSTLSASASSWAGAAMHVPGVCCSIIHDSGVRMLQLSILQVGQEIDSLHSVLAHLV